MARIVGPFSWAAFAGSQINLEEWHLTSLGRSRWSLPSLRLITSFPPFCAGATANACPSGVEPLTSVCERSRGDARHVPAIFLRDEEKVKLEKERRPSPAPFFYRNSQARM
jgi:hypothetical protein